jgi:hypothetical protein
MISGNSSEVIFGIFCNIWNSYYFAPEFITYTSIETPVCLTVSETLQVVNE